MRLRPVFLALTLVPAIQMTARAQKFSTRGIQEAGEVYGQTRPVETAQVNLPGTSSPEPTPTMNASAAPNAALPAPVPPPLDLASRSEIYSTSYRDAYQILKEDNSCSRFFGGAGKATEVLNSLAGQLKTKRLENSQVGIMMSGQYVIVHNQATGASYRRFEKVLVNTVGPLFIPPSLAATQRQAVGRFRTDTRAARALMLLHEIGHLMKAEDGRWLLPDDGKDIALSWRNTQKVESHCFKQLTSFRK